MQHYPEATNTNITLDQGTGIVIVDGQLRVSGTFQINGTQTIDMGSNKITSVGTPAASTDVTTKGYVDGLATNYATAAQGAKADSAVQSISLLVMTVVQYLQLMVTPLM